MIPDAWPWLALAAALAITVTALDTALAVWWGRRSRNAELARLGAKLAIADQACADRGAHIDGLMHEMAAVRGERDRARAAVDAVTERCLADLTTALAERDAALRDAEGWQAAQTLQSGVVREWIAECTALRATVADLRAGKAAVSVGKRLPHLRTPDGRFSGSRMGAGTDWRVTLMQDGIGVGQAQDVGVVA